MTRTKILLLLFLLLAIVSAGVIGYQAIEGWGFLDSLYQTVITISTVGFREVYPLSESGKIFTIVLVMMGISFVAYAATQLVSLIVEGEIREFFGKKRMEKVLRELKDHHIICGYGRMGVVVAENLRHEGASLAVVDIDPDRVKSALEEGFIAIAGNATQEDVLRKVGIERARAIAAVLPDDPDNLYLVITARSLNPHIRVVSKAMTDEGAARLEKVGADVVIPIYTIGGERMSVALTRPEVLDFIDIGHGRGKSIRVEEIILPSGCRVAGKTISESGLREKYGITILVIKRGSEVIIPGPSEILMEGDILLVVGDLEKFKDFMAVGA